MLNHLYTQLSLRFTSNQFTAIRLGLASVILLATAILPQIAWACDVGGGHCGG